MDSELIKVREILNKKIDRLEHMMHDKNKVTEAKMIKKIKEKTDRSQKLVEKNTETITRL